MRGARLGALPTSTLCGQLSSKLSRRLYFTIWFCSKAYQPSQRMEKLKLQELSQELVLLRMLTAEPAPPQCNAVVDTEETNLALLPKRKLSLRRELDIVDNLTFVCATSGNPENVIALCIEEGVESNSCTFRIAMNTKIPKELMNRLRSIAGVLEKTDPRSKWH